MLAFELKGEVVRQMAAFVVASQQEDCRRVPDLEGPEIEDALDRKVPTIDIVAEKQIAGVSGIATDLKQLHQVVILAVDISTDRHRGFYFQHVGFLLQDPSRLAEYP